MRESRSRGCDHPLRGGWAVRVDAVTSLVGSCGQYRVACLGNDQIIPALLAPTLVLAHDDRVYLHSPTCLECGVTLGL